MGKKDKAEKVEVPRCYFTKASHIVLGATYRDVVTETEGIAIYTKTCLTGCDRVALESRGGNPKILECDVTTVDWLDDGVSERFEEKVEAKPGATHELVDAIVEPTW